LVIMTYLGRLLRGMMLKESGARELRDQLIMLAEGVIATNKRFDNQPKQSRRKQLGKLQQQASYLTTSVVNELRKYRLRDRYLMLDSPSQALDQEAHQLIRDAIYTALYAEVFYEESLLSRIYVDALRGTIPKSYRPANLLKNL
jgi:hypothetical protein